MAYGAKDLVVLEGLDAVRMRPGMYIGSTGNRGMHHILWEIIDNSIDELANGYGNYHNLTTADHPVMNVASLKGEKMDALLKQYEKAFVAKRLTDSKEKE